MGINEYILLAEAYPATTSIIGVVLAAMLGALGWLCVRLWAKSPAPMSGAIDTIEKYEALVKSRIAEAKTAWQAAEGQNKEMLAQQIDELNSQLKNSAAAFEEMKADNLELSAQIKTLVTPNGPNDVLEDVENALNQNNRPEAYSKIKGLIAASDPAVHALAKAEFIAAEISEKDIRWHDAYAHAKRAYDLGQEVEALELYARMAWRLARNEEGVGLQKELVRRAADENGEESAQYAAAINNLASLYNAQGRYDAAEPLYKQAMEICRVALGEEHADFATSLNNLALLYKAQGRYEAAEPLYKQAMEIRRVALGEEHPDFATSLNNLALLYKAQGRYEAAEPLYTQAMEIRRAALSEEHPKFATSLNNLAELYRAQGRYEDAEPLYTQSTEIRRVALGEGHPDFAGSLHNLAGLYYQQGRYEDALPLSDQAVAIFEAALPAGHPDIDNARIGQAGIRAALGGA